MVVGRGRGSVLSEDYWRAILLGGEAAAGARVTAAPPGPGRGSPDAGGWPEEPGDSPATARPDLAADEGYWRELAEWLATGRIFRATVIGCNKGGLLVRVNDGVAFVPASQLADPPSSMGSPELPLYLESMVGGELEVRLIELDRSRHRVICSERATLRPSNAVREALARLEGRVGEIVAGTVRSVCDFGAFVDVGGLDGLVHVSELSWRRVGHPADVLNVGDDVQVVVLSVDKASRRVALSLKRLRPDPWRLVGERYDVGDIVDAVITNLVSFGAFAEVAEGVEGLIHLSELADGPLADPSEIVPEGRRVRVRVLHVDPVSRRLGLSLRQVRDG